MGNCERAMGTEAAAEMKLVALAFPLLCEVFPNCSYAHLHSEMSSVLHGRSQI